MKISSIRELEKITKKIRKILLPGDTIFLYGEIGVGKTTFSRLLINSYQKENNIKRDEVLSPTFNIVFEYEIKNFKIQHFDLYRLKSSKDIKNIGLFENNNDAILFIEWPEIIKKKPVNVIELYFSYEKNFKKRSLKIITKHKKEIINEFK